MAHPSFSSVGIDDEMTVEFFSGQGIQKCILIGNEALVQIDFLVWRRCSFVTIYFPFFAPPVLPCPCTLARDQTIFNLIHIILYLRTKY